MKKIILTLNVLFFTLLSFSQGIAIQGIARDDNNTAKTNVDIALTFEVYYLNASNTNVNVYTLTQTILTDSFGVFSHVLDIPNETESQFSNRELYLKISDGSTTISDELFKRVPLAYSASNGVPTGSIMPFVGATAPVGWVLCNGDAIPVNSNTEALRTLLGSANTPNLQGMFLRGTGRSPVNNQSGPGLKGTQSDSYKSHSHDKGSLSNDTNGSHNHSFNDTYRNDGDSSYTVSGSRRFVGSKTSESDNTDSNGNHTHQIKGSVANSGSEETRPVSYGVNYIIKL